MVPRTDLDEIEAKLIAKLLWRNYQLSDNKSVIMFQINTEQIERRNWEPNDVILLRKGREPLANF